MASTPENPGSPNEDVYSQKFQHPSLSARVPERIARGVFSTGVIVQDGPDEFCIDFLQAMAQPRQVGARVVLSPNVFNQFIAVLRDNLAKYEQSFGPPPVLPRPNLQRRPTIQEIYDELKLSDDLLSGVYANAVMVGHSPSDFHLDFITRFYPTAAVGCRIYMAAPQIPRLIETLTSAWAQFERRRAEQRRPQEPPPTDPQ